MSEPPQTIETSRLRLRFPTIEDAAAIFEQYAQDKQVTKYMTWRPHSNIETTQKFLQQSIEDLTAKNYYLWVILQIKEKKAIGMIRVQRYNYRAELGYRLLAEVRGKGKGEGEKVIFTFLFPLTFNLFPNKTEVDRTYARVLMS